MNLEEFRKQYPEYNEVDDSTLADGLYRKYYEGQLDRRQFDQLIGFSGEPMPVDQEPEPGPNLIAEPGGQAPQDQSISAIGLDPVMATTAMPTGLKYLDKFRKPELMAAHPQQEPPPIKSDNDKITDTILNFTGRPSDLVENIKRLGMTTAKSANEAVAGFVDKLDKMSDKFSEWTGMEKGGAFGIMRDQYLKNADYWNEKLGKTGLTEEIAGEILGASIPGVFEFWLNVPYAAATGYAESGAEGAAEGAVERFAMGKLLHAVNSLKLPSRAVLGGIAGSVQAAAQGGDPREIAKSTAAMAIFSASATGKGKLGFKEAFKTFREQTGRPATEIDIQMDKAFQDGFEGKQAPETGPNVAKEISDAHSAGKWLAEATRSTKKEKSPGERPLSESVEVPGFLKKQWPGLMEEEGKPHKFEEGATEQALKLQFPGIIKDKSPEVLAAEKAYEKQLQKGEISIGQESQESGFMFSSKETEARYQQSHGAKKPPLGQRLRETYTSIKNKVTREFEALPNTGEFAEAGFSLRKLAKQKDISSEKAIKEIQGITWKLNTRDYDLFNRKVIMDDFVAMADEGKAFPLGFTKETVLKESERLNKHISGNKAVLEAIEQRAKSWDKLKKSYSKSMKDIGFDVSKRLQRENYFRHQVLEYINIKGIFGTGKKLKTPSNRSFLKKRKGGELDINTNYLEAEHEVMAQMIYDMEVARTIKHIDNKYNIAAEIKGGKIPDGYVEWQPREGNVFYFTDTIPAKLAKSLNEGILAEANVSANDLRKAMAIGGKRKALIIKEELAETLDNMVRVRSQNPLVAAHAKMIRSWKVWQLISPRRYAKYNFRNITGDADAMVAGNPASLKKVPKAIGELYNAYVKKSMSPELQEYFDRGGMGATLQAQEMGSLDSLKIFRHMIEKKGKLSQIPLKAWNAYWKSARMSTDFRESILRYASYLDYLEQMQKSKDGLPKNYGASRPQEIKGLSNIRDRAFMLSNDLLGAYDRVSVFGQALREQTYPFWSWKEVNYKRYYQLFKNAADSGTVASTVGRKLLGSAATKTPYLTYRIGKFMVKASAFWAGLQVWNHTRFSDEEKGLPPDVRNRPHIIFGKDAQGNIIYFSRLGALPDLLEWFGLDAAPEYIDKLMDGESPAVIAREMAKSPVNVMVGGAVPFAKMGLEMLTRRALFPDAFKPRTIRDRGYYIAQSFGLQDEYKAIAKLPRRPYGESLQKGFIYKIDPLESAYFQAYEIKNRFLKKIGRLGEGFYLTPRGNALLNVKAAMRYGDKKSAQIYLKKYFQLGGTPDGMVNSFIRMDPLSGISKKDLPAFYNSLPMDDKQTILKAYKYYAQMFERNEK